MKELTNSQSDMLESWLRDAEKNDESLAGIQRLEEKISALTNSMEYKKSISYFPRLVKL